MTPLDLFWFTLALILGLSSALFVAYLLVLVGWTLMHLFQRWLYPTEPPKVR